MIVRDFVGISSQHDVFLVFPTEKRHQGAIRLFCGQTEAANRRWAAAKRRWAGRGPQHAAGASCLGSQWAAGGLVRSFQQRSVGIGSFRNTVG